MLTSNIIPICRFHWPTVFTAIRCLILCFCSWAVAFAQNENEPWLLEHNKASDRTLTANEKHVYWLDLKAGDYLNLSHETNCLLKMSVFQPDGSNWVVETVRALSDRPEDILEKNGRYRVEVEGLEFEGTGWYSLLATVHPHTSQEATRIAGRQPFQAGERLRQQNSRETLRQSIGKFEEALRLWRAAEFRVGEADALSSLGRVYRLLGERRRAIEYYQQALPLWQVEDNRFGEGFMLMNLGVAHSELGEKLMASEYYRLALVVNRGTSWSNYAGSLLNLGTVSSSLGDYQLAIDYLNQALNLAHEIPYDEGEAQALNNLGSIYQELGEYVRSREYYQQALAIWQKLKNPRGQAMALTNVGKSHIVANEGRKALEPLNQALALEREVGNQRGEAYTLNGIGRAYHLLGEAQHAIDAFNQALNLLRTAGDQAGEAYSLNALGNAYHILLKDQSQALEHYLKALALARRTEDRLRQRDILFRMAEIYRDRNDFAEARRSIEQAIAFVEADRMQIPSEDWRASFLATEQVKYNFLIDLLLQQHKQNPQEGHAAKAFEISERARARTLLEVLSRARSSIRQGIDPTLVERETDLRQQLSFKEQNYTRLLSGRHSPEQAESAKKELEKLLAEQREVAAVIRARSPAYAALTQPESLTLAEVQSRLLDDDTALLEYALGEERSYVFAVTKTSFDVYELPRRAEIEDLAGEFYRMSARTFIVQGEWRAESEKKSKEIASNLSQMILQPLARQLGKKRLLIVAQGALQYIPFAALPASNGQPLILNHEIISLPSASTLSVLRRELSQRRVAPKTVAVLGDPVFSKDDPRFVADAKPAQPKTGRGLSAEAGTLRRGLRLGVANASEPLRLARLHHTRSEALAIASFAASKSKLLALDFDVNRQLATSDSLSQYRIVHFATHGWLDAETPDLSAIVLSLVGKDGQPQNGFLRLHEIYNLNLPAELVVLSACETGIGKEIKGEGLISLTRGFMYAGARRVLVSLWPVDDPATAELMKRFYRGMLKEKLNPAAALKKAQLEMMTQPRWRSPYYWAGFTLQGER